MQPTWQEVLEFTKQFRDLKLEYWLNETLFTFSWWILLLTTVGVFILWTFILEKKRIFEIVTYGFFVAMFAMIADDLGVSLSLWNYPHTLTPIPLIIEVHKVQMPILYMIVYQYFNTWKTFLVAAAVNAFIFAFILERLLVWLHVYEAYHWEHIYSLIPYFLIAVGFKWVINQFKKMDQNYQ